jgi:hypothetical protein
MTATSREIPRRHRSGPPISARASITLRVSNLER